MMALLSGRRVEWWWGGGGEGVMYVWVEGKFTCHTGVAA